MPSNTAFASVCIVIVLCLVFWYLRRGGSTVLSKIHYRSAPSILPSHLSVYRDGANGSREKMIEMVDEEEAVWTS